MRSTVAAAVAFTAVNSPALAQPFIEIGWDATIDSFDDGSVWELCGGRAVFDASAPPLASSIPDFLIFFEPIVAHGYSDMDADGDLTNPLSAPPAPPSSVVALVYQPQQQAISLQLGLEGGRIAGISIVPVGSDFMPDMTSLPDDPAAYGHAGDSTGGVTAFGSVNGYRVNWRPIDGFEDGSFRYWIREVPNPNPPAPCIADADGNGILNLDDLDAFVASFLGGCP